MTGSGLLDSAAMVSIGGVLTWLGNMVWQHFTHRADREDRLADREDRLAAHNSSLAIQLLEITKTEAALLRHQVRELQDQVGIIPDFERRLAYFEEALLHIEALLDPEGLREAAEHNARLFLSRMMALREGIGLTANFEQRERARRSLARKEQL